MTLYCRTLKADEQPRLEELARGTDEELARRAQIVLLSAQHICVHEISRSVDLHPINVRKWIHRYNRAGIKGLLPRRSPGRPKVFTRQQREAIVRLAATDPRSLGLAYDAWSLQRLRTELIEQGVVEEVSSETIRQQLIQSGLVFDDQRWIAAP